MARPSRARQQSAPDGEPTTPGAAPSGEAAKPSSPADYLAADERLPSPLGAFSAKAPLRVLVPRAVAGMVLVAAVIAARFYFAFGTVPPFAWGFIGAVTVFQVLLIVGLRFQDRPDIRPARPLRGDRLDKLGGWWLMACAFGALLGWVSGEAGILLRSPSPLFPLGRILFGVVLPLATMLPNVRYVSRSAAFVQVPLLVGVTMLPVLVGLDAIPALLNNSRP